MTHDTYITFDPYFQITPLSQPTIIEYVSILERIPSGVLKSTLQIKQALNGLQS